jgi:hypothetical protein
MLLVASSSTARSIGIQRLWERFSGPPVTKLIRPGGDNSPVPLPLTVLFMGSGIMRQLKWSADKNGTLNGKVGSVTLFVVAYYPERGHFVVPKLPGLNKTIPTISKEEGKIKAESIYHRYIDFLNGAEWQLNDQ